MTVGRLDERLAPVLAPAQRQVTRSFSRSERSMLLEHHANIAARAGERGKHAIDADPWIVVECRSGSRVTT